MKFKINTIKIDRYSLWKISVIVFLVCFVVVLFLNVYWMRTFKKEVFAEGCNLEEFDAIVLEKKLFDNTILDLEEKKYDFNKVLKKSSR
ncbi:hypothetical protein ACFLZC_01695 [Patescibacteria group bacterium]